MEDWQFVTGPAVADITGDPLPEVIATSGGFFVHAFNAAGIEPAGWPKLTGQWQTATPSIGDLDGDGTVEVVRLTRLGTLFVWRTAGATGQPDRWRKFRHDEWNTGAYGADTRRPARIDDLRFSTTGPTARLDWTAVGDDGRCGRADQYELRASSAPITRANFASATPVPVAGPAAAGALAEPEPRQRHRRTVHGDDRGRRRRAFRGRLAACGRNEAPLPLNRWGTTRGTTLGGALGRHAERAPGGPRYRTRP